MFRIYTNSEDGRLGHQYLTSVIRSPLLFKQKSICIKVHYLTKVDLVIEIL